MRIHLMHSKSPPQTFLQACRGPNTNAMEKTPSPSPSSSETELEELTDSKGGYVYLPKDGDRLTFWSTVRGMVSYR